MPNHISKTAPVCPCAVYHLKYEHNFVVRSLVIIILQNSGKFMWCIYQHTSMLLVDVGWIFFLRRWPPSTTWVIWMPLPELSSFPFYMLSTFHVPSRIVVNINESSILLYKVFFRPCCRKTSPKNYRPYLYYCPYLQTCSLEFSSSFSIAIV